jgi:sigma-B regulation protein RsbU (phosphoserine phosphatase)
VWHLCLKYVIGIPYALFANELLGKGWKSSIAVWLWSEVAFAVIAIPTAFLTNRIDQTDFINGLLIIGGTLSVLFHAFLRGRTSEPFVTSLKWPLIIFGAFVVLTNRGFRVAGVDVEPVGFLILLAGLCVTSVRRALTNERKLIDVEQELATARRIQDSIIPHSASGLPSVRLATLDQPMTSVAGDFYDFLKPNEHCLTILVADVSGHGVPAALVASMLKVCFAAQLKHAGNPAEILAGLGIMLRGSLGGQYVTAACAAIDAQAGLITYAGAGHPPSLLLRKNGGEIVQLAENGLFIGPFPNATYSNISVPFQSGDRLLLYTDGIIEATASDGQEFGRENLESFLRNTQAAEPTALVAELFQRISSSNQQDRLPARFFPGSGMSLVRVRFPPSLRCRLRSRNESGQSRRYRECFP